MPLAAQPLRIALVSLAACAKNLVDSETLLGRLAAAGAVVGVPEAEAEVIIVNTCGFIEPAKQESIDTILSLAEHKRTGACRKLLVMGCLSQRYGHSLREALPEADGVFGLHEEARIVAACGLEADDTANAGRLLLTPKRTAYLRISDGCDNRCAYCAIPLIRGPLRSRAPEELVDEAEALVDMGVRELNVIAQDTTCYGADLPGGAGIHDLLARLNGIRKLRWIRLLYTHPAHFSDALIEAYAGLSKLCLYVDLPIQHLDDAILKRMGRKVSRRRILELVERIRTAIPDVAIRTSVIVGFPGETRDRFNRMLADLLALRFEHLGAFGYSREDGTPAARMRGAVPPRAIQRRLRDVMTAQQEIAFAANRLQKGRELEVLIQRPASDGKAWIARSRFQGPDVDGVTLTRGNRLGAGRFVRARVTGFRGYDLLARTITKTV